MSEDKKRLYRVESGEDTLERFIDDVAAMKDEESEEKGESVGKLIYDKVNSLPVQ